MEEGYFVLSSFTFSLAVSSIRAAPIEARWEAVRGHVLHTFAIKKRVKEGKNCPTLGLLLCCDPYFKMSITLLYTAQG